MKGKKLAKRRFSKQDICPRRDGNKKKKSREAREAELVGRGGVCGVIRVSFSEGGAHCPSLIPTMTSQGSELLFSG